MVDSLTAPELMNHVNALAKDIGPRPPGSDQEQLARNYIRKTLNDLDVESIEEIDFSAPDSWGYAIGIPLALSLVGNLVGLGGKKRKVAGGILSLLGAYNVWCLLNKQKQPLEPFYPKNSSATLLARIPCSEQIKRRVVLIGHTDTNKHRSSFSARNKSFLRATTSFAALNPLVNGLAQLAQAADLGRAANVVHGFSFWSMIAGLTHTLLDEQDDFVDGANDNASAVAALLGLGAYLKQNPLQNTEVWLAFTGAKESGLYGIHALLDWYRMTLRDAWFIDFEMVGSSQVGFVTEHSSFSHLGTVYHPDTESVDLAVEATRRHPELEIRGWPIVIHDEVGALRQRGYRGICLAGVGAGGWPSPHWHQYTDTVENVDPAGIERAARFSLAMMQLLDEQP